MPTLAACLKKHVTDSSDRELVRESYEQLKEDMPAAKAKVQAVREALSAAEDERDTFLGNLEKGHKVTLERPERMPPMLEPAKPKAKEAPAKPKPAPKPAPKSAPKPVEKPGAEAILTAARSLPESERLGTKAYIAAVWRKLDSGESLADFKQRLVDLHRAGELVLTRADLGPTVQPELTEESKTGYLTQTWNQIETAEVDLQIGRPKREGPPKITVQQATEIAQRVYAREGIQSPIRIRADVEDLPQDVREKIARYGDVRPRALQEGGTIYLLTNNTDTELQVEQSIIHELIHIGNRRKFGAELGVEMKKLFDAMGGEQGVREIARKYGVEQFIDDYQALKYVSDARIANELMSYVGMMQNDPSLPARIRLAIKRFLGAVRQLLRKYGLMNAANLNDSELLYLIGQALDMAKAPVTGVQPIMAMDDGKDVDIDALLGDIAFQLQEEQDNVNLYANRPSEETETFVQKVRDYAAGYSGKGITSELGEKYGFWDEWIGTVDNVAAKNPNSPMPVFFHESKGMRMDQDETFALTKVAVDAFNKLKKPQQARLTKALFEGTNANKRWDDPTLEKQYKLDEEAIGAYKEIRKYLDIIKDRYLNRLIERTGVQRDENGKLSLINENMSSPEKRLKLAQKMIDDFEALEGYMPQMRFGDYTIAVRKKPAGDEKVGELVYFDQAESKGEMRRKAGMARRLYPDTNKHDVTTGRLERLTGESMVTDPRLMAMLQEYVVEAEKEGIKLVDDAEKKILETYEERSFKQKRYPQQSFKNRLIRRKGIPGYSENVNRVLASYGWSAANHLSKMKYIPRLQALYDATSEHKYPQIREHMARQIRYMRGGAEGAAGEEFSWFKSLTFAMYMGLNIKSAAVNLTQVPMVLYPYLASKYGDVRAIAAITRAQKAALLPKKTGNPTLDNLLAWAEKEGLTMDAYLSDLMGLARGKRLAQARLRSKAMSGISFMFSHAERYNRRVSAAAEFYANPNRTLEELKQALEKSIRGSQYDYGKHNRGRIFQGWTSMPMQFHQFSVNYLQSLHPKTHGWGNSLRMVGMLWLATGLMGMPGADDLRAFIEYLIQKAWGKHIDLELEARKVIVEASREYFGTEAAKTVAESVLRGHGAYLAGDIGGSLSMSRVVPGVAKLFDVAAYKGLKEGLEAGFLEAAGAGPGFIANALRGIDDAIETKDWRRAAERGPIPVAAQNFLKALRISADGVDRDVSGRVQIAYRPDLADNIIMAASFQPSERSRLYRIKNRQLRESRFVQGEHSKMLVNLAIGYAERDMRKIREARADIRRWNQMMPRRWFLSPEKVRRSIKARRRRFEVGSVTGQESVLRQLRMPLNVERARYYQ